jgi:general secretion pathway protein G
VRTSALLAVLLLVCACRQQTEPPALEAVLKENLTQMRKAIDNFYADHQRYPATLEELVPNYIREIPRDPMTGSATTWRVITEETVQPNADFTTATTGTVPSPARPGIVDVRSGAGKPYSEY